MSIYDQRPWLARYNEGQAYGIDVEFGSVLDMFGACVQRDPGRFRGQQPDVNEEDIARIFAKSIENW